MTFVTFSLVAELEPNGMAANTFWLVTAYRHAYDAVLRDGTEDDWPSPEIVADAVCALLDRDPEDFTGNTVYDEEILREAGVEDFSEYNVTDGDPMPLSAQMFDPEFERYTVQTGDTPSVRGER